MTNYAKKITMSNRTVYIINDNDIASDIIPVVYNVGLEQGEN